MYGNMAREALSPDWTRSRLERKRSRDSGKMLTQRPSMSSNGSSTLFEIDMDILEGVNRRDSQPAPKTVPKGLSFFQRSNKNWLNPTFNSRILENVLKAKLHEYVRRRFRATLGILCIFCGIWLAFFSTQSEVPSNTRDSSEYSVTYHWWYIIGGGLLLVTIVIYIAVSFVVYKASSWLFFSFLLFLAIFSYLLSLTMEFDHDSPIFGSVSFVVQFSISSMLLIFIHVLSLQSWTVNCVLSVLYILILEILHGFFGRGKNGDQFSSRTVIISRVTHTILLICVNLIAANAGYFLTVRHHDTFWKITQCLFYREGHSLERVLKEKTIHSLIPNHIANSLMTEEVQQSLMEETMSALQFPLYQLDNVSILFADIVGFTSLSATMPAAKMVAILNDIFSKFDHLARVHNCEKISTLGDCYFCVSGCPQADPNHASNIVDMGLGIVSELQRYKRERGYDIDMRVGIHTGTVLSGVIGTKRFKYDVWSEDVSLAGQVERCGVPGQVMITEATYRHISSAYTCENVCLPNFPHAIATYWVRERRHHSTGTPTRTWKYRIRNIDLAMPVASDRDNDSISSRSATSSSTGPLTRALCRLPCLSRRGEEGECEMERSVSTDSIIEIMNRRSELDKCRSIADHSNEKDVDQRIVEMIEKNNVELETFFETHLQLIWLTYGNPEMEKEYRSYGKTLRKSGPKDAEVNFCVSRLSFFVDVFISFLLFTFCCVSVFLAAGSTSRERLSLIVVTVAGIIIELPILVLSFVIFKPRFFPKWFVKRAQFILNWNIKTGIALICIFGPMSVNCLNLAVCHSDGFVSEESIVNTRVSFYILIVVLTSTINFMEVSYLAKLFGGIVSVSVVLSIAYVKQFTSCSSKSDDMHINTNITSKDIEKYFERHVLPETIILLILLLFLLIQVNRMSETTVRRQFNGLMEAWRGKRNVRLLTDQANRLLSNIIPKHVNKELRKTGKFSKDHDCVGVIFASIENLHSFVTQDDVTSLNEEESVCKIRLLSEIVSHFDNLLSRKDFGGIEKIKTIGSTYMAASGLLEIDERRPSVAHLVNLVNFALQLTELMNWMNIELKRKFSSVEELQIRIGFNFGPVTSGVVGTSKLLYDIWGDTVNVASRMQSTGVTGKIQLPSTCTRLLDRYFEFERHGTILVKGKGDMETVFITGRRRVFIQFEPIPEQCDIPEDCEILDESQV
ncbi:adenylate cyclase type 9-like isoform X2 [Dysidea avara]|uniref:adenylate cyclase type 9-like isoform X2 n=1 Tax=Dysidea avara TaxID=196820 RepID=UPI00331794C5